MLNFIFRFFSFQCCYTWIWPSRFYERWLSKVLNSRINLLFMNKRRSKWSKHDTGVTHYNATEISKSPLFEGSALVFQKSRGGDQPSLILNCFARPGMYNILMWWKMNCTFFFLNDLIICLAIDTVFHPSGIFKMAWNFFKTSCLKMV